MARYKLYYYNTLRQQLEKPCTLCTFQHNKMQKLTLITGNIKKLNEIISIVGSDVAFEVSVCMPLFVYLFLLEHRLYIAR